MVGALERVLVCSPRTAGWNLPERREQWLAELQKQGKYTEGASLKELIEKRDGEKTGSEGE